MFLYRVGTFLFTVFFWTISLLWTAILAFTTLFLLIFFPYQKVHNWVPAPGFDWIVRFATLGKFKTFYDPQFDPNRRSVFCMNHINLLDAHTASAAIPHAFCGLMNAWQAKIPFYGWLMKLSKGILLDPQSSNILETMTEQAKLRKREEMSILTFPEAHRTIDGKVGSFKRGVFFMAREAGFPIVPIAVKGMYNVNRKGSFRFTPSSVTVFVGPQFETQNLTDGQIQKLADNAAEWIRIRVEKNENLQLKAVNG